MRHFQRPNVRTLALLLIPALAFGPVGCGMEDAAPAVIEGAMTATFIAIGVQEFQKVESTRLDNDLKRLQLQGERDGRRIRVGRLLTADEYRQVSDSGQVNVDGLAVPVRFGN